VKPGNFNVDAISPSGKRIEIKHRAYAGNIPPGMKVALQNVDYVLYVELDNDLLPKHIYRIKSEDIEYTTHKRVSFRRAFKENKARLIFQR